MGDEDLVYGHNAPRWFLWDETDPKGDGTPPRAPISAIHVRYQGRSCGKIENPDADVDTVRDLVGVGAAAAVVELDFRGAGQKGSLGRAHLQLPELDDEDPAPAVLDVNQLAGQVAASVVGQLTPLLQTMFAHIQATDQRMVGMSEHNMRLVERCLEVSMTAVQQIHQANQGSQQTVFTAMQQAIGTQMAAATEIAAAGRIHQQEMATLQQRHQAQVANRNGSKSDTASALLNIASKLPPDRLERILDKLTGAEEKGKWRDLLFEVLDRFDVAGGDYEEDGSDGD